MKRRIFKLSYILPLAITAILHSSEYQKINLSRDQADFVAQMVWENEAAGELKYLIHWNKGEGFLSLGIAHFLWYSKDKKERYLEMFPLLVEYLVIHNVRLPDWLDANTPCPWDDRESFLKAKIKNKPKYQDLYNLLVRTMPIQVNFIIERMNGALPEMLKSLENKEERMSVRKAYNRMIYLPDGSLSTEGVYAVLDYVNFKGEGTSLSERYKGEGWGLLQVLMEMDPETRDPLGSFREAAKKVLQERIENSPPERNESRWKSGWYKRIDTYRVAK
ncbi:MAG: hypothetical protein U9Q90_08470 [Campylobacterota bacterium]|nr:hypothetical protein [Campylobacterota bacterium]